MPHSCIKIGFIKIRVTDCQTLSNGGRFDCFLDHETELKDAKSRLRELELTLYTQRDEVVMLHELVLTRCVSKF